MKLPKTLRDKRDAQIQEIKSWNPGNSNLGLYNSGYDACFSDMSEAVQGLLKALEQTQKAIKWYDAIPNKLHSAFLINGNALAEYYKIVGEGK